MATIRWSSIFHFNLTKLVRFGKILKNGYKKPIVIWVTMGLQDKYIILNVINLILQFCGIIQFTLADSVSFNLGGENESPDFDRKSSPEEPCYQF